MAKETCPKCSGTSWILEVKQGKTLAHRCSCFKEKKKGFLISHSNIPKRYDNCSFDNFEIHNPSHRKSLKISKKFVKDYPVISSGLLFMGPCGIGKTHLAVAIIKELMQTKNVPCYFCDFRELIRDIQASYSLDSHLTESNVLSPVFQKEVLVLDELGAKRTTAWVEEMVFYIINNRYIHKKLTIFTSNYLDREEDEEDSRDDYYKKKDVTLVDRVGERLRSRIYEMCKIVEMYGDDYRKKIKQASYRW